MLAQVPYKGADGGQGDEEGDDIPDEQDLNLSSVEGVALLIVGIELVESGGEHRGDGQEKRKLGGLLSRQLLSQSSNNGRR